MVALRTNKANSRCRAGRGRLYKQTQFGVPSREEGWRRGQTKPNLGDLGYLENGIEGLVQTNPIWREARDGLLPRTCAGRLYKQTQSAADGQLCQTNPIPAAGRDAGRLYKQTQFGGTPAAACRLGPARAGCPNKPNLPQTGNCVKQTQFPPYRVAGTNRSCQTKPISRLRISRTAPGNRRPPLAELSDCGSGTDFRRSGRLRKTKPIGPAGSGRGGEMRETNPIRPRWAKKTIARASHPSGWASAPNKANLAGRRDTPPFHYSIIPVFQPHADCAKRSQSDSIQRMVAHGDWVFL
jgi:hypothetical protein